MGPGDVPETKKVENVDYAQAQKDASHDEFMGELMKMLKDGAGSHPKSGTRIENQGQIDSIDFPEGWVAGKPQPNPGIGARSYREVFRKDNPDTSVSFFYRGLPINDQSAHNFRDVLSKPPHALSEQEKESLKDVLSTKTPVGSDQFKMTDARVEDLNGKKVLVVEGQYTKSGDKIHAVYVDADGTGRVVQEIFYQSPADQYAKYWKQADRAFKSIDWK